MLHTKHAPHFGGLLEAAVKSFRYHFQLIVGGVWITFEEFTTVLKQLEAGLNSRPLTPLSPSVNQIEALGAADPPSTM